MTDFIRSYMAYCAGYETPEIYDLWSALSTIASVVNRRVWIDMGYFRVYPHMYVVLVGPPAARKTSAMEISQIMLEDLGDVLFAGTAMTKEALAKKLEKEGIKTITLKDGTMREITPITLCLTELSHFLGVNNAHMIDFLVTVYDKENYKSETKNMGNDVIPGPGLNILACTTPSNITRYLKEDVISGGFSSRTHFVLVDSKITPIAFPVISPEAATARLECLSWLKNIQPLTGEFVLTDEARAWYKPWYDKLQYDIQSLPQTVVTGWLGRKQVHLLKAAMVFALSSSTDLVITSFHLQLALAAIDRIQSNLERVYEGIGRNELSPIQARAFEYIDSMGGSISEKELHIVLNRDASYGERMEIIRSMIESGRVDRFEDAATKRVLLATPKWKAANTRPAPVHNLTPAPGPVPDAPAP